MHENRAVPADDQIHGGHVFAEVITQVAECVTYRLEFDAGIEQILDGLEFEQIAIGVPPARPAALCIGDRGPHQIGTRPVVELPVGDAHDVGRGLAAVASGVVVAVGRHEMASEW